MKIYFDKENTLVFDGDFITDVQVPEEKEDFLSVNDWLESRIEIPKDLKIKITGFNFKFKTNDRITT